MKLTKKDTNLLLVLLGLLIFIGAYLGIANRYNEKTLALQQELTELTPRLEELREHEKNLPEYEAGIDKTIASVNSELTRYPSDVRPEDLLLYALELNKELELNIDTVSFMPAEKVSGFDIVRRDKDDTIEFVPMAAMKTGFSASSSMDYEQLKKFITYIYTTKYCTTLDRVSIVYNAESGGLTTSMDVSKYFVTSQDYKYVPSPVPEVSIGTDDPFKTFTVTRRTGGGASPDNTQN